MSIAPRFERVVIPVGQTSADFNAEGYALIGIALPGNFDGTTLTISHVIGGTAYPLRGLDNSAIGLTSIGSLPGFYRIAPTDIPSARTLRLTAGSSQSTDDTVIYVMLREVA